MELFFNLSWVVLSSLLLGFWLLCRNSWTDESTRYAVSVQIVALALLIVVLLPVVSLTDDLQACAVPAESEHLSRRSDFQNCADLALHAISVTISGLIPIRVSARAQSFTRLPHPAKNESPYAGYLRILGTRPPPAV